jgi:glycosyltransferase involved in cell wall biosynthesis
MKIIIIETGGWGGIGHYAHCLSSALQDAGNNVVLFTHVRRYQLEAFKKNYSVIPTFQGDGFVSDWLRLNSNLNKFPADIVHFQSLISTRRDWVVFLLYRILCRSPRFIYTVHNVLPHEIQIGEKISYNLLYRSASGLIVHSKPSLSELISKLDGISNTPTKIIPHGHYGEIASDDLLSRSSAIDLLSLEDYRYIVFFGTIRPYKGIHNLLEAVARIPDWPKDLRVLIVGQPMHGVTEEELISAKKYNNLEEKVVFKLEYIPDQHIPAVFKLADLVALPYIKIDQSGVLLAALAAGCPVLCTPVGAFPETVHPGIGFLAAGVSADDLKTALIQALQKRKFWDEMGDRAKKESRSRYSWDSIAKKTTNFYQEISR